MPYKDPEKARESARLAQARYRARHPGLKRELTERDRKVQRAASKRWREANRERHRRYCAEYKRSRRTPCPVCGELKKHTAKVCIRCLRREHTGKWKGGSFLTGGGYRMVLMPDHPHATKQGYVAEHRLVVERRLGRYLLPDETVHHKNGLRADNQPDNLEVWSSHHPPGQRAQDLLAWAREIIARYG